MLATLLIYVFCGLWQSVRCDFPTMQEMDIKSFVDGDNKGYTAAYGDVNSDKQTDLFTLQDTGNLSIYIGSEAFPALRLHQVIYAGVSATSAVPADFNGDEKSDVLITYNSGEHYTLAVFWGIGENRLGENASRYLEELYDEPLVMDANGDMISDLFIVFANQSRGFLLGQKDQHDWKYISLPSTGDATKPVYSPHSHAFIDLTDDGSADLFITTKDENKAVPVYEVWKGTPNGINRTDSIHVPSEEDGAIFGHATFADFTGNAKQDIAVSTCVPTGNGCTRGKILIYTDKRWHTLFELPETWSFPDTTQLKHVDNTLHITDVNLDSYPDVMTIVTIDGSRKAVILYNIPCQSEYCGNVTRQLGKQLILTNSVNAIYASFYDFKMDGTMDVILTVKDDEGMKMKAYENMIADDVTFLRVQVLTGSSGTAVYGVNVPGPQITYETTNVLGGSQLGRLGQLSQSAHLSLQLPYVLFGLGRAANFVDTLTVSIPVPLIVDSSNEVMIQRYVESDKGLSLSDDTFKPLHQTWPMLIPNSQLYVIPYPIHSPSSWSNRLLVKPGQNVITTGLVLLGTCGVLVVATLVLHWLEKREDKQEKIQEAHRFHFDAM